MAAPLVYLLYQGASVAPEIWMRLLATRVPDLLVNTLTLAGLVTLGALGLGLLLAWLVERTDLPGRRFFRPLMISPLIVPSYLLAICYAAFFGSYGILEKALRATGWEVSVPGVYGLGGVAFVLILVTYPYVYVVTRVALQRLDPTLLDAARCTGAGRGRIFLKIVLPLLTPALSAGGILATLYVLSDFGAVTALRYPTFVSVIYQRITGSYDLSAAAALGTVLVLLTFALLWVQGRLLGRRRFVLDKSSGRAPPPVRLGVFRGPALALIALVLLVGLLLPLGVLLYWLVEGLASAEATRLWGMGGSSLWKQVLNSFAVSAGAATLAVALALPLTYAAVRSRDALGRTLVSVAQSGQALPGVLIALGVLFVVLRWVPALYATVGAVLLAYLIRFFSQALQSVRSGLEQTPACLEEGARLLGHSPLRAFARVTLPLMRPALTAGWTLVFLSTIRELPTTLLLRPAGFDTLPVRIWTAASEGFYAQAAPAALLLVGVSIPLLVWLHRESPKRGVRCHE
jgi:iron(III) transport system permease protein